jgi:hypothetical protein
MSHVALVDIEIKSIDDLKAACKRLGFEFHENKTTYKWWGRWYNDYHAEDAAYLNGVKPEDYGKCLHAIHVPGCQYEVGVIARPDGKPGFSLIWDFMDTQLQTALGGQTADKLRQNYATAAAISAARKQGFRVSEQKQANGAVKLVFAK